MGTMHTSACDECLKLPSFDESQCQRCPLFLLLTPDAQDTGTTPSPTAAGKLRPLLILGVGVISAGICAAMLDLAMIAGSLITFGFGACLADHLLHTS